jgi:perosamine synthetase
LIPKQIIYPLRYLTPFFRRNVDLNESEFRRSFSELLNLEHECTPIGRARAGIYLLIKLSISEGRNEVLLSPYTIPDVVNMVLFAGGRPIFVDFEPKSTAISLTSIQNMSTERTAAVIVTHYHINQGNFHELLSYCKEKEIALVEDCAIALGGTIEGKSVGTQSFGAIFSLSSYKFLNYFWGGSIFCNDTHLQRQTEEIVRTWPRLTAKHYRSQILRTLRYDVATRPLPYRLLTAPMLRARQRKSGETQVLHQPRIESTELDSTLTSRPSASAFYEWCTKIGSVRNNLAHRRKIATIYQKHFPDLSVGQNVETQLNSGCFVNFPIWIGSEKRDRVYKALILGGIDVGLSLYPNTHEHEKFRELLGESANVANLARSVISLPCHPRVTEAYANRVIEKLKQAL